MYVYVIIQLIGLERHACVLTYIYLHAHSSKTDQPVGPDRALELSNHTHEPFSSNPPVTFINTGTTVYLLRRVKKKKEAKKKSGHSSRRAHVCVYKGQAIRGPVVLLNWVNSRDVPFDALLIAASARREGTLRLLQIDCLLSQLLYIAAAEARQQLPFDNEATSRVRDIGLIV